MTKIVYRDALFFDGTGSDPVISDIAVSNGKISAIGPHLKAGDAAVEINCKGLWLIPGLLDIHTHLDLEIEIAPELPEVVQHGTTTVVISNCSLGVTYGNLRRNGDDPIVSCFARVENMPKCVLTKVADACTWTDSQGYLDHLESLPLGPNVVPLIPHSMLRVAVMGLDNSIERLATRRELRRMQEMVEAGMAQGYAGLSTDALPFHFLANDPHKKKRIPTQYASFRELFRLTSVVRRHGRVWQATPPKEDIFDAVRSFLLTSGRIFGRPLKTTVLAAIDLKTNRSAVALCLMLSKILNSRLIKGAFHFQAMPSSFRLWSDGAINLMADEIHEFRTLNELEPEDREGRAKILNDPDWIIAFRKMWLNGKKGISLARLQRLIRLEDVVLTRNLKDMIVADCPLENWNGETLEAPWQRLLRWQASRGKRGAASAAEAEFFSQFPDPIGDDAEFFLHLLRVWDTDFRWETTVANCNPKTVKKLLFHPQTVPGFNDSGAHLANIAFYDGNLRALKIAQEDGLRRVSEMVYRLTGLPAAFFGVNAGVLRVGAQADLCLIDPEVLRQWDPESTYELIYRSQFGCRQVINRPTGVVKHVMISGKILWNDGSYTPEFGKSSTGRVLRPADHPLERQKVAV
ncbi:amidohydrolase family protein [Acetobacter musti]|uniref:Amidohydrolase family protein n=1 Tax=Acetobacter musti TaxID=864732 RepID=A0ABX0JMB8_9PROT|nr:amidohydrolase family protein [Acetobacter musti]